MNSNKVKCNNLKVVLKLQLKIMNLRMIKNRMRKLEKMKIKMIKNKMRILESMMKTPHKLNHKMINNRNHIKMNLNFHLHEWK